MSGIEEGLVSDSSGGSEMGRYPAHDKERCRRVRSQDAMKNLDKVAYVPVIYDCSTVCMAG